jgi:integrase
VKFEEVFDSYMTVSGRERSAAYQDKLMFQFFRSQFGRNFEIEDVTPRLVSRCLSVLRDKTIKRRGSQVPLSPATINRHTQFLQRVFNHASDLAVPVHAMRWKAFIMVEAEQRIYPLTEDEEKLVLTQIEPAIRPLFSFSMLTGVRLRNAIELTWGMINNKTQEISFRGKSRRPGGKTYIVPITSSVHTLLSTLEGDHPEHVFTFVAKRNDKHGHKKGVRYPLTDHVVRFYWEKLALGKRWHDVRHTFGTRLYGISRDIHLVQRAMNHSDVHTTQRYVHTNHEDVRAAMEKLAPPTAVGVTPFSYMNDPSPIGHNSSKFSEDELDLFPEDNQAGAAKRTRTFTSLETSTSTERGTFKSWDKDQNE